MLYKIMVHASEIWMYSLFVFQDPPHPLVVSVFLDLFFSSSLTQKDWFFFIAIPIASYTHYINYL